MPRLGFLSFYEKRGCNTVQMHSDTASLLLIINSLLVLPAAAARNVSKNIRQYHLISILISLSSGIIGLVLSYYLNTVTGATIVLISAVMFFITLIYKQKFM